MSRFRREIMGVLVIKGILLGLLWWICFRDPVAPHLTSRDLQQQLVGEVR